MGLKQINDSDRIIFLRNFTKEILFNSIKDYHIKKKIEVEKIKQKFIEPLFPSEETLKIIKTPYEKPVETIKPKKQILSKEEALEEIRKKRKFLEKKEPPRKTPIKPAFLETRIPTQSQKLYLGSEIKGAGIEKIRPFLMNRSISSIECPGPGRNLLIKRYNRINMTKTILGENEIKDIINDFAEKARIPLDGGILKAAVDNLVISAVTSEFAGSRFIINKTTTYSLLEEEQDY